MRLLCVWKVAADLWLRPLRGSCHRLFALRRIRGFLAATLLFAARFACNEYLRTFAEIGLRQKVPQVAGTGGCCGKMQRSCKRAAERRNHDSLWQEPRSGRSHRSKRLLPTPPEKPRSGDTPKTRGRQSVRNNSEMKKSKQTIRYVSQGNRIKNL